MLDPKIIAQHYIIAALWADAPEGTRAPRETEAKALQLARDFLLFPACAGMNRQPGAPGVRGVSVPRVRGDEPT